VQHPRARFTCVECDGIAGALRAAWRGDKRELIARLREVAASSGRDTHHLAISWVFSVASMPEHEMKTLLDSHYPRLTQATQQRDKHRQASGHSVTLAGSLAAAMYYRWS
jgi:hypothetical protein